MPALVQRKVQKVFGLTIYVLLNPSILISIWSLDTSTIEGLNCETDERYQLDATIYLLL